MLKNQSRGPRLLSQHQKGSAETKRLRTTAVSLLRITKSRIFYSEFFNCLRPVAFFKLKLDCSVLSMMFLIETHDLMSLSIETNFLLVQAFYIKQL